VPRLNSSPLALAQEAQAIFEVADREGRALDPDERQHVESLLNRAEERGEMERRLKATGLFGDGGQTLSAGNYTAGAMTPGQIFTSSEAYKSLFGEGGARGEKWTIPPVEIGTYTGMKGTLLEGSGAPGSGSGGGLVPAPQVVPGVVETLFQPLVLRQLMSSNVATNNTVRYVVEGTTTSGAAGVAEGGTKPESTLGLSTKDEPIKKIATFLPVSDELLEDAPALQNFLNYRLSLFVSIEEERQLIRGTSGGNEVQGLLTSRGVPVYTGGTADNKAIQLFKAANSMRGSAFLEPEWFVLNPTDYQIIRLLTDTSGQLLGGGPFLGPYGGPQGPVGSSAAIAGVTDTVWGKPTYVTQAIGPGTAIIGTMANACVWSRGGIRVEASNAHSNFFQMDLVALRAEERIGLAVYRASGFVQLNFAVGPGG
jgi:HK97 family phage major capsid protein